MIDEYKLRSMISELTGCDISTLDPDEDLMDVLAVDSIDGLRIYAAIEGDLNISFSNETLGKLRSINQMVRAINGRAVL